ncbi:MAG TPA: antibiotic biosynthesis monooxygenase [Vicinamibacterales bacterium]
MVVVVFRSRLVADAGADYSEMAAEMLARAKTMPGFLEFKSFKADDGEKVSLVYWQDEETMRVWRHDPRHRDAQHLGRDRWYQSYRIEVAHVDRSKTFDRDPLAAHEGGN